MLRILSLLLLLACLLPAQGLHAQVRRCTAANGSLVYTDRACADIGASVRVPPAVAASRSGVARTMCSRTIQDLAYALSSAVQSGDVNRIAGLYDWTGGNARTADPLLDRMERIASLNLVDMQPVYSQSTPSATVDAASLATDATPAPTPPSKPRLIGLRIDQVSPHGLTPSHTTFGLHQRLGCWWLHL